MIEKIAAIVLAAGKGTRLAAGKPSLKPKVLYEIAGRPLILYTLELLRRAGLREIVVVVGHKASQVEEEVGKGYKFAVQPRRLGTGHAAACGLEQVSAAATNILVVNGDDSAFYKPETIQKVLNKHIGKGSAITFVTVELENPYGFGRVLRENGKVIGVIEEKVAQDEQKKIKEVNDGVYFFRRDWLENNLPKLAKSAIGEYYLVDLIGLAASQGEKVETFKLSDARQWRGVNTRQELQAADKAMRERFADAAERE